MFSRIVLIARKKAGLENRSEAARRLGISSEALRRIEKGENIPRNELVEKMVDVYEMNETQKQRLCRTVFLARKARSKSLIEQEELKQHITDLGTTQLASKITGGVMELLRKEEELSDRALFVRVEQVVTEALRDWRGN